MASTIFEVVIHVIQQAAKIRILIYEKCALISERATVRSENQAGRRSDRHWQLPCRTALFYSSSAHCALHYVLSPINFLAVGQRHLPDALGGVHPLVPGTVA